MKFLVQVFFAILSWGIDSYKNPANFFSGFFKHRAYALVILLCLTHCNTEEDAPGVIGKDKMAGLLTDLHLLEGYTSTLPFDSLVKTSPALYNMAFNKYSTDSAQFNKSLKYYSDRPKELNDIYVEVKKRLEIMQKQEDKRMAAESVLAAKKQLKLQGLLRDSIQKEELNRAKNLKSGKTGH